MRPEASLGTPPVVPPTSRPSGVRARTRVTRASSSPERHLFVNPASGCRSRARARVGERRERRGAERVDAAWTSGAMVGPFHLRCVYAGGYRRKRARVYREERGEGARRRGHVRVRERVRVRAHIRMTPRRVGSLPTVRDVHHPRLTGGTRPLCAL